MDSRASLAEFNAAVVQWSSQFASELQRLARITGNRMGWDHHEFTISWSSLQRHYQAAYGETISLPTLKKHARLWADQGGLKIIPRFHQANGPQLQKADPGRLGKDGKRVGTRGGKRFATEGSNTFVVDFGTVVKGRKIHTGERGRPAAEYWTEPWTFGQAGINLPLSSPSVAGQLPRTTSNSVRTPCTTYDPGGNRANATEVEVSPAGKDRAARLPAQPGRQWEQNPGDRNTVTFWVSGGKGNVWTHDNPRPKRVPGDARTVILTPDESSFMWHRWPRGFPLEQIEYLQAWPSQRRHLIESEDRAEVQAEGKPQQHDVPVETKREINAARVAQGKAPLYPDID